MKKCNKPSTVVLLGSGTKGNADACNSLSTNA